MLIDWLTNPDVWASFIALSAMEIVLGIDNVVFISLLVSRLPAEQAADGAAHRPVARARSSASSCSAASPGSFISRRRSSASPATTSPGATSSSSPAACFSWSRARARSIRTSKAKRRRAGLRRVADTMTSAILQIAVIDLVFSIDSIITAVGMADHVEVMIAAVAVAILVMYFASEPVAHFIERHPTTKMLALSFLLLDRRRADRRRHAFPYPAPVHLLRHGLCRRGRGGQRAWPRANAGVPRKQSRRRNNQPKR